MWKIISIRIGEVRMLFRTKKIDLTNRQSEQLKQVISSRTERSDHILRANIILACSEDTSNSKIARALHISRETARKWRCRWLKHQPVLTSLEAETFGVAYKRAVLKILSDEQRPGSPGKFSAEQICQILAVACEQPKDSGLPISHWSLSSLVEEVVKRKIVDSISTSQLAVFLKSRQDKAA